jgi:hypothetical protein
MFIKSCEPPPVYQISTIGRLEICTSASAAKGNVEKAYLQEMLVMHITVYHRLLDGGREWRRARPPRNLGKFLRFRSQRRCSSHSEAKQDGDVYMLFYAPFSPERFLPSSQRFVVPPFQSQHGTATFEASELNTNASDTQLPAVPQTRY